MDANLDLKDSRVPTFIPFEQHVDKSVTKPATKRKRTAKNDSTNKPQKKKALKSVKKGKMIQLPWLHYINYHGYIILNQKKTLN